MVIATGSEILLSLFIALGQAHAQDKVTDAILVGQSSELSGEAPGKENLQGASLYFDHVNRNGGVNGRKIALKSYDDQRSDKKAVENTKRLIEADGVFVLFGYRSTPTTEAVIPLLSEARVPLVAPFTGSTPLHTTLNRYVFNVRASYAVEAAKAVEQVTTFGFTRIAILHQSDAFGKDGLQGYQQALRERNLSPIAIGTYDRKDFNVDAAVKAIHAADPQAVLMACTPKACVNFIKQMHSRGAAPMFITLSNVSSKDFVDALGNDGRGVGMMQVVPYPWNLGIPIVKEFRQVAKEDGAKITASYATLEGFAAAKVLVEGLRRTGQQLTREKFIRAMESMQSYDAGGFVVSYSPQDHGGSRYVGITVIGKGGKISE